MPFGASIACMRGAYLYLETYVCWHYLSAPAQHKYTRALEKARDTKLLGFKPQNYYYTGRGILSTEDICKNLWSLKSLRVLGRLV